MDCCSVGSAACRTVSRRSDHRSEWAGPGAASVVSGGQPHSTEDRGLGLANVFHTALLPFYWGF